jgi:MscS family membrane protein
MLGKLLSLFIGLRLFFKRRCLIRQKRAIWFFALVCFISCSSLVHALKLGKVGLEGKTEVAPLASKENQIAKPPLDPLGRGAPRGMVLNFMRAGQKGDLEKLVKYLDFSGLPRMSRQKAGNLAEKLYISLRRGMLIDKDSLSVRPDGYADDGLKPDMERLGFILLPDSEVEILLKRMTQKNGRKVWLFAPATLKQVPSLYEHLKIGPVGNFLSRFIPSYEIFGLQLWQLLALSAAFISALLLCRGLMALVAGIFLRKRPKSQTVRFLKGPLSFTLAVVLSRSVVPYLDLSMDALKLFQVKTLFIVGVAWCIVSLAGVLFARIERRMSKTGQSDFLVLLHPLFTIVKVLILVVAILVWLDNIGFQVTTILASLGIGGIAVALAAQDTLKNVFGSTVILLDKPFQVGDRILVQDHDGFVESIGLRSTELRRLDGQQAVIPNEILARVDILNISRRPHIRQISDIHLSLATEAEKIHRAVQELMSIMADHEGMKPELPPRIFFNAFERDSLNIRLIYWYHPPDFWDFSQFNHNLNLEITALFHRLGIRLTYPLALDPLHPVKISLAERPS